MKTNRTEYYLVEAKALPEVMLKVVDVQQLIKSGKVEKIQDAVDQIGISRSVYYKYRDAISPFYNTIKGRTVTFSLNLDDNPGVLSHLLQLLADFQVNVLTINQSIPLNNLANVTITVELHKALDKSHELFHSIEKLKGIRSLRIIAKE